MVGVKTLVRILNSLYFFGKNEMNLTVFTEDMKGCPLDSQPYVQPCSCFKTTPQKNQISKLSYLYFRPKNYVPLEALGAENICLHPKLLKLLTSNYLAIF